MFFTSLEQVLLSLYLSIYLTLIFYFIFYLCFSHQIIPLPLGYIIIDVIKHADFSECLYGLGVRIYITSGYMLQLLHSFPFERTLLLLFSLFFLF